MNRYKDLPDRALFDLLKSDDHMAYTEIYHRYKGVLYVHAYKRLGNREEARDVLQELFTSLWDRRYELTLRAHLSGYLYASIRNRVIKVLSHKEVETAYMSRLPWPEEGSRSMTDYLVRERDLRELIEKEIHSLPRKMQEVFLLSRQAHLSHREIAHQLNLSESTVKKQVNNALKILRMRLGILVFLMMHCL